MTQQNRERPTKICIIDDDRQFLILIQRRVEQLGYEVATGMSGAELFDLLDREQFDTVVLDIHLPDADGLELLEQIRARSPELPVIVETADSSGELGFKASALGAYDFIQKPIDFARLEILLRRATDHYAVLQRFHDLETTIAGRTQFGEIIGADPAMQVMYSVIENVAASDATVFVTGESGTGKELVARAVHRLSKRSSREMVDTNCAAIPENLLESELFGHEKGAFTGATQRYVGCCERAHNSTLFLDEIREMNFGLQAKLLRFIQERNFYRLGGRDRVQVEIRIVAATNKDPLAEVEANRLREDLYYRLNVVPIRIPPLRERPGDVRLLAEHFLQTYSGKNEKQFRVISDSALELLTAYSWPGNVRELQNTIAQVAVLHAGSSVEPEMLPSNIRGSIESVAPPSAAPESTVAGPTNGVIKPIWQVEKEAIENALRICGGKVPDACRGLQMSRATLYRKVKKYGIPLT